MKAHILRLSIILALLIVPFASVVQAQDPVELTMWTFLDPTADDPRGMALADVVASFNDSHDDIQVSVENIHFSQIDAQAIQAAATGAGPDLINIYSVQLPQHVAAGSVQPVTGYASDWLANEATDYAFPLEAVTFNGEMMSVPWETRVWVLWYRQDVLEEMGLEVPTTLDELAEVGGAIMEGSGGSTTGLGIGLSEGSLGADFMEKFEPLLWAYGGQLLDDDGNAAFAGPEGVQAMQWMYDAVNTYGAMDRGVLAMGADEVLSGFRAGSVAMTVQGSMRVASARSAEEVGANLITAPVPGLTADEPLPGLVAGQTLAIGANTEHPDEAWEFIQHYLSLESQLRFAEAGVMPVRSSAFEDPQIAESEAGAELLAWSDYARDFGRMGRYPDDFPRMSEILVLAAQQIIFNDAPIEETLQAAAEEYNAGR